MTFSLPNLIKLAGALAVLIGSVLYFEGYMGDVRDTAGSLVSCRRIPDEVDDWRGRHTTIRPEHMERLERWAREHPDRVDVPYGASCETLLHEAADFGRVDAARILLANGADPEARDRYGRAPLHLAAREGHPEVVELLVEKGAKPDVGDRGRRTPLMEAVASVSPETREERLRVARVLLDAGVPPDTPERGSRRGALHAAAGPQGDPAFVRLLLDRGARVDLPDSQDETPLHQAATAGNLESARLLLDAGADPNAGSRGTPLAGAAYAGHLEIARLLVERGADVGRSGPESPHPWGSAPLELTVLGDWGEEADRLAIAAFLADGGAEVDARSADGRTLLHETAETGRLDWVRFLLDHGAEVDAQDVAGLTPLHEAVRNAHLEVARLLVDRGADAALTTGDGTTPLARAGQDPEMQLLLRSHGAR
jgi:ankyrin repeat protein